MKICIQKSHIFLTNDGALLYRNRIFSLKAHIPKFWVFCERKVCRARKLIFKVRAVVYDKGNSKTQFIVSHFSLFSFVFQIMDRWENQGSPQTSLSAPAIPQNLPFPPALHRSSFPDSTEAFDPRKPDPYELYEKSRAIYESRRKWKPHKTRVHLVIAEALPGDVQRLKWSGVILYSEVQKVSQK